MVIDDIVYFGVAPQAVRGGPKSPLAVGECSCGCDRSDRSTPDNHPEKHLCSQMDEQDKPHR